MGAQRLEAAVRGRVQGVGFRVWVLRRATQLGLTGWVTNEPDGSVSVVAEGDADALDRLEALLRRGPGAADVAEVRAQRGEAAGASDRFEVRSRHHSGD